MPSPDLLCRSCFALLLELDGLTPARLLVDAADRSRLAARCAGARWPLPCWPLRRWPVLVALLLAASMAAVLPLREDANEGMPGMELNCRGQRRSILEIGMEP
ncbi:unnamed protein product [Linum trigynum]|uniref:Uncharacterized protein n=1 Tax=Linum trigynum TaxID=586398 RepID=A0AAV2ETZ8_9ROSI